MARLARFELANAGVMVPDTSDDLVEPLGV